MPIIVRSEALRGATVLAAAMGAMALFLTQRHQERIKECRSAIRDLKRFRELEDIWAAELLKFKLESSPETERRRMRNRLMTKSANLENPAASKS